MGSTSHFANILEIAAEGMITENRRQAPQKTSGRKARGVVAIFIIVACAGSAAVLFAITNDLPWDRTGYQPLAEIISPTAVYATVTASSLNVRSGPSTGHNIQDSISENTRVEILEMVASPWVRIRYGDGRIGYVSRNFLSY